MPDIGWVGCEIGEPKTKCQRLPLPDKEWDEDLFQKDKPGEFEGIPEGCDT